MRQKITVLGSFVVDLMARTPHLPAAGETVRKTLENTARRPFPAALSRARAARASTRASRRTKQAETSPW